MRVKFHGLFKVFFLIHSMKHSQLSPFWNALPFADFSLHSSNLGIFLKSTRSLPWVPPLWRTYTNYTPKYDVSSELNPLSLPKQRPCNQNTLLCTPIPQSPNTSKTKFFWFLHYFSIICFTLQIYKKLFILKNYLWQAIFLT